MKLLFLSDFIPSKSISFDKSFIDLIEKVDKVIFNLEGSPLTNSTNDSFNQIMPFKFEEILDFFDRFDRDKFVLALANNHILDNGLNAYDNFILKLHRYDIKYFGTRDIPFINLNNSVSILNFVTAETVAAYKSWKRLNYIFYSSSDVNRQIKELERRDKQLILYPHWGRDMDRTVFDTYDLQLSIDKWHIFGHHPHVISGISEKRIYSLGNTFIPHPYYYSKHVAMRYGIAVIFDSRLQKYSLKLTKVISKDGYKNDFRLTASAFEKIPNEVLKHGTDYSVLKKSYHSMLSFKGNGLDFFKLSFLQLMSKFFELKRGISKK